jgi:hypothetical protein
MTPGLNLIGWFSLFSFDTPHQFQFIISITTIQQSGVDQFDGLFQHHSCSSPFKRDSRDSSVGIQTGYGLNGSGSIRGRGKVFFSSPQVSDRLWGPPIP